MNKEQRIFFSDLAKLADGLPPLDDYDHLENLHLVYAKNNNWNGVDLYVTEVLKEASRRSKIVKLRENTYKKLSLLKILKNKLKWRK